MTNTVTFHVGDVRDVMANMPDSSVDLILTSPPFLALRSYLPADHPDKHREIGSEPTPAVFLDTLLELSAEWRRLLTSTGSLCVEIGDTYSGSGGAGGDYGDEGWRAGQLTFKQQQTAGPPEGRGPRIQDRRTTGRTGNKNRDKRPGWPLDKSLCLIPTLYTAALAYGLNPLTGQPSQAGQWRVRNLLTWTRPNPPVGALGDKFRPATSFVTVACTARNRWFDLDAVRGPGSDNTHARLARGVESRPNDCKVPPNGSNRATLAITDGPAGAPPLDWWEQDWQPLHRLPTAPYAGAHYAAYPLTLPRRLIDAMCPLAVCVVCGEPRRRITGEAEYVPSATYRGGVLVRDANRVADGVNQWRGDGAQASVVRSVPTLGWTDCGHCGCGHTRDRHVVTATHGAECSFGCPCVEFSPAYRPGVVCDPFGGSGTTAVAAALAGRDALLIDLDRRNVDLCRQRLTETLHIVNEHHDGDTWTWTVRNDLPGLKGEHPDQVSLFAEEAV